MFKNKHIIAALIIAPLLAIGAYFATDHFVAEKPHKAKRGASYELIPRSNCRYTSGHCTLSNGNFKVELQAEVLNDAFMVLSLDSEHFLDGAKVVLVESKGSSAKPTSMRAKDSDHHHWQLTVPRPTTNTGFVRLALAAEGAIYYAETGTQFIHYETAFEKDFR